MNGEVESCNVVDEERGVLSATNRVCWEYAKSGAHDVVFPVARMMDNKGIWVLWYLKIGSKDVLKMGYMCVAVRAVAQVLVKQFWG
jgi:hypothetical protein